MKNHLFIIIIVFSMQCFAQDPQLFENTWYLQKLTIDSQDIFPPVNDEIEYVSLDITENDFETTACNSAFGPISVINNDFFDLIEFIFIDGDCFLQETLDFGVIYFSDFLLIGEPNPTFFYIIDSESSNNKVLTLTNTNGDLAIYGNELLSTQDFFTNLFTLYPNPVQGILNIENYSNYTIEFVQIYDMLGRLVLEENGNVKQLDISYLNSGLFLIKIETDEGVLVKKIVKN